MANKRKRRKRTTLWRVRGFSIYRLFHLYGRLNKSSSKFRLHHEGSTVFKKYDGELLFVELFYITFPFIYCKLFIYGSTSQDTQIMFKLFARWTRCQIRDCFLK